MQAAGALARRLTILRWQGETTNDLGEPVEAWTPDVRAICASRQDVSDGEKATAGASIGTLRSRFVVRSSSITRTVTIKDRVSEGGKVFAIVGIKQIGRNDAIEWTADSRSEA